MMGPEAVLGPEARDAEETATPVTTPLVTPLTPVATAPVIVDPGAEDPDVTGSAAEVGFPGMLPEAGGKLGGKGIIPVTSSTGLRTSGADQRRRRLKSDVASADAAPPRANRL
jgi:hypothetical protein